MADKDFKNPVSKTDNGDSKNNDESPPHERLRTLREKAEVHIAYLNMQFPDIAEESLIEIYMANNQDIDDAMDMLTQLKVTTDDESSETVDTDNASKSAPAEPNKSEAETNGLMVRQIPRHQ